MVCKIYWPRPAAEPVFPRIVFPGCAVFGFTPSARLKRAPASRLLRDGEVLPLFPAKHWEKVSARSRLAGIDPAGVFVQIWTKRG